MYKTVKRLWIVSCLAIISPILLLCGCTDPPTARFSPLYDKFSEITLAGKHYGQATYVLDGFSLRWDRAPHRVNKLAAGLLLVRHDLAKNSLSAVARMALQGAKSDKDTYRYALDYTMVRSSKTHFYHGEIIELIPDDYGNATSAVCLKSEELGFPLTPEMRVAVILRGFYLNTDISHGNGFPIKDFGVGLSEVKRTGKDKLCFNAHVSLVAGRRFGFIRYGASGNRIQSKLMYTVVALEQGNLAGKNIEMTTRSDGTATAPRITIRGAPGKYPVAFTGIRAVRFQWNKDAHLLRGLRFRNSGFIYDPAPGVMRFRCGAAMDNSGRFGAMENKMRMSADFVLVQVGDPGARVSHKSIMGGSRQTLAEKRLLSFWMSSMRIHIMK